MKKSLIALAVASAVSAPVFAATSNVDIYGQLNMSVDIVDRDGRTAPVPEDEFRISSGNSRIGFKGAEDFGNGLSAIWQIESEINLDGDGASTWATRNTYVGLMSRSLGTVKLGRHDTAYKMSTGKYDVFINTLGDYNVLLGSVAYGTSPTGFFNVRATDSISYSTPNFSGLSADLTYGQRNEAGLVRDEQLWSVAVSYANGPLSLTAAYEAHDNTLETSVVTSDNTAWKVGAGYVLGGNTRLAAIFERIKSEASTGTEAERDAWYVSAAHKMGNVTLKGAYGMAKETDFSVGSLNDEAQFYAVGVDYSLSKRTTLYALYTGLFNDPDAAYTLGSTATTGAVVGSGPNSNPEGGSIGMKHSF